MLDCSWQNNQVHKLHDGGALLLWLLHPLELVLSGINVSFLSIISLVTKSSLRIRRFIAVMIFSLQISEECGEKLRTHHKTFTVVAGLVE